MLRQTGSSTLAAASVNRYYARATRERLESAMYEEFYGLTEKPFSIQPDPSFLFWGRGHRLAYAMLEYGVVNQAGISVITGEVGCGKTTLIHRLLEQLSDTHTVALLSNIQPGRGELLSWVLMGLGEPYSSKTHVEMFAQLQQFFIREYSKGKRVVLIIDEAQNLSVEMLEELRMLSNINAGKDQLLQLILVGQPQLKDLLSRPDMLQLAQRIGSDFHLSPLSREEVHSYIETRLTIAGSRRRIFSDGAMDLVAEQSRGVPRVINIIADTALVYSFSAQDDIVSEETVRSVIRDKLDYGVFGLASSPNVKLTEWKDARSGSGFLRELSAESARPVEAAAPEPAARITRNMGVRLVAQESAVALVSESPTPIGGLSLFPKVEFSEGTALSETTVYVKDPTPERVAAATPREKLPIGAAEDGLRKIGVVVIGGDLDIAETLHSLPDGTPFVIAAGAQEEGLAAAKEAGVNIVEINDKPNGGRARNAGYRRLKKENPDLRYVQFLEAGAMLAPGWLDHADKFMARRPEVSVLEGRTTLSDHSATVFDRLYVSKSFSPPGEIQAAGPNALYRAESFEQVGGFRGDIVADATADLCIRLRRRGAHVWRTDAAMSVVEPRRLDLRGWRLELKRAGFESAAGAALHGSPPERFGVKEQSSAFFWGGFLPALICFSIIVFLVISSLVGFNAVAGTAAILVFGATAYVTRILTHAISAEAPAGLKMSYGLFVMLGRFSEFEGVMRYWVGGKLADNGQSGNQTAPQRRR
ncbi:MAG: AAA family ATPase [Parvularculaceae bacterium]|nr:AAA family ATPase [Parvularculaceae bacterium]